MLRIYNTLTRKVEEFKPQNPPKVTIYACGPTVYDNQHIGHMRRYLGDDILVRVLKYNGYDVKHAMNITDVGHLVSDSDTGEDKMEKGAQKFGLSVWDLAKKFEQQFWDSISLLNIQRPKPVMKATDFIKQQISLIQKLEEKGFTYKIEDGVYFDTSKFKDYFKFSRQNPEELKKGARVDFVEGKKNVADFALWKFSPSSSSSKAQDGIATRRQMEWESPWGIGFPGWHIECSAMAMDALGETIDIHTGGIDHINIHHTNEIAQSETATGKKFVNYWVHHNFLMVDGHKMSKSLGNLYTVEDVIRKGFDPMALRYLYLQTHYRQEMNFTWESLNASQVAYNKLLAVIANEMKQSQQNEIATSASPPRNDKNFNNRFLDAINDDLNMPKALAIVWEMMKSDLSTEEKLSNIKKFDQVLGLQLELGIKNYELRENVPQKVLDLVNEREAFRKAGDWGPADELRKKIEELGYILRDGKDGTEIVKK